MTIQKTDHELIELKNGQSLIMFDCHFTHFVSGRVLAGSIPKTEDKPVAKRAIAVEDIKRHVALGIDENSNFVETSDPPYSVRRQHWS